MGTSKGIGTPSGGGWTPVKTQVTGQVGGRLATNPLSLIGGVVAAAGGLGAATGVGAGAGRRGGGGAGGFGGGGGGGGGTRGNSGKVSVGGALSGLAGFGAAVRADGLDAAVTALGLAELRGRPATEVVARIAEHLTEAVGGAQGDLLALALKEAILECAAIETGGTYEDLDNAMQAFLARDGVEGLAEAFLGRFVFDRVWSWIENHAAEKAGTVSDTQALASAVESACRQQVRDLMNSVRDEGRFNSVDWFGNDGVRLGQSIVSTLEFRLESLYSEEA